LRKARRERRPSKQGTQVVFYLRASTRRVLCMVDPSGTMRKPLEAILAALEENTRARCSRRTRAPARKWQGGILRYHPAPQLYHRRGLHMLHTSGLFRRRVVGIHRGFIVRCSTTSQRGTGTRSRRPRPGNVMSWCDEVGRGLERSRPICWEGEGGGYQPVAYRNGGTVFSPLLRRAAGASRRSTR